MSTIQTLLANILAKRKGEEVRGSIHDAIAQCYSDVNNPTLLTDGIEGILDVMVSNGRISGAIVEDLGLITEGTSNLFDFTTITAGRLNTSTGAVDTASGYWVSDYIPVESGKKYYFTNTDRRVAYTTSKAYSSSISSASSWTAPSDGYIRISVTTANRKTAKVNEGENKEYRPGRAAVDFNLRDDVYRKNEVNALIDDVTIETDDTLSQAGAAADAAAVGAAISELNGDLDDLKNNGMSDDVKEALLACFAKVAYIDEQGERCYNDLYDALYGLTYPDFTCGNIVLKSYYDNDGNVVTNSNANALDEKYYRINKSFAYIWVQGFNGYVDISNNALRGCMQTYRVCYYDANKTFIRRDTAPFDRTFGAVESRYYTLTPPENAEYFRISWSGIIPGQVYKTIPNDLYAVTILLANTNDAAISTNSNITDRFSVYRDGVNITDTIGVPEKFSGGVINIGTIGWCRNVFDFANGGSPKTGNQNTTTQTVIYNAPSFILKEGDVIKFNNVKYAVRAERIVDGELQHSSAWVTNNADFVVGV